MMAFVVLFNSSRWVIEEKSLTRRAQRKTDGEHSATAGRPSRSSSVFSVSKPTSNLMDEWLWELCVKRS